MARPASAVTVTSPSNEFVLQWLRLSDARWQSDSSRPRSSYEYVYVFRTFVGELAGTDFTVRVWTLPNKSYATSSSRTCVASTGDVLVVSRPQESRCTMLSRVDFPSGNSPKSAPLYGRS